MNKDKNKVFDDYTAMIINSWTYDRMTKEEKTRIIDQLNCERTKKEVVGTYIQRWRVLNLMYSSFLEGLGYKPSGWRE